MKSSLLVISLSLLPASMTAAASLAPVILSTQSASSEASARQSVSSELSADGNHLVSKDSAGLLLIHTVPQEKPVCSIQLQDADATVVLSPDAKKLAEASAKGIVIYDVPSGQAAQKIAAPQADSKVNKLSWSPDGTRLLVVQLVKKPDNSGLYGEQFHVIDASTGKSIYQSEVKDIGCDVSFASDANTLFMTSGRALSQVKLTDGRISSLMKGLAPASIMAWNPQHTALAIKMEQGFAVFRANGERLFTLPEAVGIHRMQWSADGKILFVSEGHQGVCKQYVVDVPSKKLLETLTKLLDDRTNCVLSANGAFIYDNRAGELYSTADQKKVSTFKNKNDDHYYHLSQDGQALIYLDPTGRKLLVLNVLDI